MSSWQTMETAPKDGTRFLTIEDGTVTVGWWEANEYLNPKAARESAIHRWLIMHNKVWHEKHEYDALVAEFGPQVQLDDPGFWTTEYQVFDCRHEEKNLLFWMPLPELPR